MQQICDKENKNIRAETAVHNLCPVNETDNQYLDRCLQLALCGMGRVAPNPMVGALLVAEHKIVGEGYHRSYGGPHAEVYAIEQAKAYTNLDKTALYVSLEPCSHYGKTPPCVDLIIQSGITKVVVGAVDPNPKVCGQGIAKLRAAGIEVEVSTETAKHNWLNRRFLTAKTLNRPYVILKWAQTAAGFVGTRGQQLQISDTQNRRWVHKWRYTEQAVLIGPETANFDQPMLSVRHWAPALPLRVIADRNLRVVGNVLHSTAPTVVYNTMLDKEEKNTHWKKLPPNNFLNHLMQDLFEIGIESVLTEPGPGLAKAMIEQGIWDEMRISISGSNTGGDFKAPLVDNLTGWSFESGHNMNTFVHLNSANKLLATLNPELWAL